MAGGGDWKSIQADGPSAASSSSIIHRDLGKSRSEDLLPAGYIRRRHVIVGMLFLGNFVSYFLRMSMSTAAQRPDENDGNPDTTMSTEFQWTDLELGFALGAFYGGYMILQAPVKFMLQTHSAKFIYGVGILGASIMTLLTPACAPIYSLLIAVRFATGLFEGVTYPCMAHMLSLWVPPAERTRALAVASSGAYLGTAMALPISGVILAQVGWRSIFYAYGAFGIAWTLLWYALGASSPDTHTNIHACEMTFIAESQQDERAACSRDHNSQRGPPSMTWSEFFSHRATVVSILCGFAYCYLFYLMVSEFPTYASSQLGLKIESAGFTAMGPYVCLWFTAIGGGWVCDYLVEHAGLNRLKVRRMAYVAGMGPASVLFALVGYIQDQTAAIITVTIAIGLCGISVSGVWAYVLDVGGSQTALLYAVANVAATIPGLIAPVATEGFITAFGDKKGWCVAFWVAAGVGFAGCLVFWNAATAVGLDDFAKDATRINSDDESSEVLLIEEEQEEEQEEQEEEEEEEEEEGA